MDRGSSVNASILTVTKKVFLQPYIQKLRSGSTNPIRSIAVPYKRIIQPKNFTSHVRAMKHQATFLMMVTVITLLFPLHNAKEAPTLLCQAVILLMLSIMTIAKCIIAGTS